MPMTHPGSALRLQRAATAIGFALALALPSAAGVLADAPALPTFKRIATFPAFLNTDVDQVTVAEIVAASEDGNTLIYTDSENGQIGFADITDPANPSPAGTVTVGGEPTSVAVAGAYALVAVNTSPSFVAPSGNLAIVDIATRAIVRTIDLGGQPDSIAVSPDRRYAAIAIENERDEDLNDGQLPQFPAGFLVIVDLVGADPAGWSIRQVDLTGIADKFPEDPEPEYVDINGANEAVVSLQENNHLAVVFLPTGTVTTDFSAGEADLADIDIVENDLIELTGALTAVPREPDGVAWWGRDVFLTADEGDLEGGSRSATAFNSTDGSGSSFFATGRSLERVVVRIGHYPEDRSENKGNEPEGVTVGDYAGLGKVAFVGSERSNVVFVYRRDETGRPTLHQVLPSGVGPEGLLAIPSRNLFVTASEVDARDDLIRAALTLYELSPGEATYPTLVSANRTEGSPIPWGALSALAADRTDPERAYTVHDSFYQQSRIYRLNLGAVPARIAEEIVLSDGGSTVNLDLEGLVQRADGSFWAVSEGSGNAPSATRANLLLKVAADGTILQTIALPPEVDALQKSNGFEGVAVTGSGDDELVYVAFQREWAGDPAGFVRIGRYQPSTGAWTFFYYPLDPVESPNGGWVGLSELVAIDDQTLATVERDNQGGTDARVKRLYSFSIAGLTPEPQGGVFPVVAKVLRRDILPDLAATGGPVLEKVEGLSIQADGDAYIVTDNDGVDDASGETQLINLGPVFQ